MEDEVKKAILKAAAPITVPIARVAISNHYENKRLAQREDFEVRMAQHKTQTIKAAAGDEEAPRVSPFSPDAPEPVPASEPVEESEDPLAAAIQTADELDQSLDQASQTEECGFCQTVLEDLKDEPLDVQRQGLRELREVQALMGTNATREEIDAVMDQAEIVPRLFAEA